MCSLIAYLDTKEHKCWRDKIREIFGNKCAICEVDHHLQAHHLIPKTIEEHRSNINNGVLLCGRHHCKYGSQISPHNDASLLFATWMMKHREEQVKWVLEHWNEV